MMDPSDSAFPASHVEHAIRVDGDGLGRSENILVTDGGLTKREYFAAKAMQGMAASDSWADNFDRHDRFAMASACAVAVFAADVLIAELNKTEEA